MNGLTEDRRAVLDAEDWAHRAARGILADLKDRRDIKRGLEEIDEDVRKEIVATLADIIRTALEPPPMTIERIEKDARDEAFRLCIEYAKNQGREWVPNSLWGSIANDMAKFASRALTTPSNKEGGDHG